MSSGNKPGPSSGSGANNSQQPKKSTPQFKPLISTTPTHPNTENWKDTDERFHAEVKADKKSFAEGKKRTLVSKSHNDLAAQAAMGGLLGSVPMVGVVEVEMLVVVETQSAPQLSGVVVHHRPFDPNLLPEEESPDYDSYIQCPHCGRKFEPLAAQRHIAQCKQYIFNEAEKENFKKSKKKSVAK